MTSPKNKKGPRLTDGRTEDFRFSEPRINQIFTMPLATKLKLKRLAASRGRGIGELILEALLRAYPELR